MRGERRVDVVAYRHVSQQRFHRRGVLVRVRQLVDERAPEADSGRLARRARAARLARARHEHHLALLVARRQRRRHGVRPRGVVHQQRRHVRPQQPLHERLEARRGAHDVRDGSEVHVQVDGMIHKPSARRAHGCARALDLFEPLDLGCQKRCRVARLVQRAARRLARAQRLAHAGARGALGLDERLERLPGLRRGLRERHGLPLRALQLQLQLLAMTLDQLHMRKAAGQRLLRFGQLAARLLLRTLAVALRALQLLGLALEQAALLRVFGLLGGQARHVRIGLLAVALHLGQLLDGLRAIGFGLRALRSIGLKRHAQLGLVALGGTALLVQQQRRTVETLDGRRGAAVPAGQLSRVHALAADLLLQLLGRGLGLGDGGALLLQLRFQRPLARERVVPPAAQRAKVVHCEGQAQIRQLVGQPLVGAGALRLALQRPQLTLHLGGHVLHAGQVRVHGRQLALAFRLALLVLQHAGGLLDESPAILRLRLQDGVQAALRDDGVRPRAQP